MILDPEQTWSVLLEQRFPSEPSWWGLDSRLAADAVAALLARNDAQGGPSSPWAAVVVRPDQSVVATCSTTFSGGLYWTIDDRPAGSRLTVGVLPGPVVKQRLGPTRLDEEYVRAFAQFVPPGERTPYREVNRIPAGVTAIWHPAERSPRLTHWFADTVRHSVPTLRGSAALDRYLAVVDDAVANLAPHNGPLAATLSGGLDSTFVVASLAQLTSSDRVIDAFCHSPHPDAALPDAAGWETDDYPTAVQMTKAFPGRIRLHRVVNDDGVLALDAAADFAHRAWMPAANPGNQVWIDKLARHAHALGADRLFTGAQGNMVFSVTPSYAVRRYLGKGQLLGVGRSLAAWHQSGESWPRVFRRRLVPALRPAAMRSSKRGTPSQLPTDVTGIPLRSTAHTPDFDREMHLDLMIGGTGLASVLGPVPERPTWVDPFTDRRVVELAARIAPEEWLRGPGSRGFARRAGAGRVPESIRLRKQRGSQSADIWWPMRNQRDRYEAEVAALPHTPGLAGWVDPSAVGALVASWPWGQPEPPPLFEVVAADRLLSLAAFARATVTRLSKLASD